MPFKKGQSGNLNGRPKGSPNKVSEASKGLFLDVMEGELGHIEESLGLLREDNPEKYLKALASLFPYFMPKQIESEITISEAPNPPSWFDEVLDREDASDLNPLTDG